MKQLDQAFGAPVTSIGDQAVRVCGANPQVIVGFDDPPSITVR